MMFTGPLVSEGMTTAVEGIAVGNVTAGEVRTTKKLIMFGIGGGVPLVIVIDAGPTTVGQ